MPSTFRRVVAASSLEQKQDKYHKHKIQSRRSCSIFDSLPGRAAVVVHIGHGVNGVGHLVVHDGVDKHCDRVLGEDLQRELVLKSIFSRGLCRILSVCKSFYGVI